MDCLRSGTKNWERATPACVWGQRHWRYVVLARLVDLGGFVVPISHTATLRRFDSLYVSKLRHSARFLIVNQVPGDSLSGSSTTSGRNTVPGPSIEPETTFDNRGMLCVTRRPRLRAETTRIIMSAAYLSAQLFSPHIPAQAWLQPIE